MKIELERAQKTAEAVVKRLEPYCKKKADGNTFIEVVGSIRRKKPSVNDIDLVLIPYDLWNLHHEIMGLGQMRMSGSKIMRVMVGSVQVDIYVCEPETWGITLLVRTGSADHNIKLAARAKKMGLHFSVARGIENEKGKVIASQTEEEVFSALGLNYILPERRE